MSKRPQADLEADTVPLALGKRQRSLSDSALRRISFATPVAVMLPGERERFASILLTGDDAAAIAYLKNRDPNAPIAPASCTDVHGYTSLARMTFHARRWSVLLDESVLQRINFNSLHPQPFTAELVRAPLHVLEAILETRRVDIESHMVGFVPVLLAWCGELGMSDEGLASRVALLVKHKALTLQNEDMYPVVWRMAKNRLPLTAREVMKAEHFTVGGLLRSMGFGTWETAEKREPRVARFFKHEVGE